MERFGERHGEGTHSESHPQWRTLARATAVVLFWGAAAAATTLLDELIPILAFVIVAKVAVILGVGWVLSRIGRLTSRGAYGAGVVWALLACATEMTLVAQGAGWYHLLGDPADVPAMARSLILATWLLSPVLFVDSADSEP